jgi:hypothetical protein
MTDPHDATPLDASHPWRRTDGSGAGTHLAPGGRPDRPRWWFRSAARSWCDGGEEVFVIPGPAQGDAFDFDLSVSCHWFRHRSIEPASYAVQIARMDLRRQLETQLREVSREFRPDALATAERIMNARLAEPREFEAGRLVCQVLVRANPGSDLRKNLQDQWRQATAADRAHEAKIRYVDQSRQLRDRWLAFLREFPEDPLALVAMRLADDPTRVADIVEAAQVNRTRTEEQAAATQESIRKIVQQAEEDHERMDVYDFVNSYESALRELLQVLRAEQNGRPSLVSGAAR